MGKITSFIIFINCLSFPGHFLSIFTHYLHKRGLKSPVYCIKYYSYRLLEPQHIQKTLIRTQACLQSISFVYLYISIYIYRILVADITPYSNFLLYTYYSLHIKYIFCLYKSYYIIRSRICKHILPEGGRSTAGLQCMCYKLKGLS